MVREMSISRVSFFFFFQAEDGIRDYKVTGVQTCALPIYPLAIYLHLYRQHGHGGLTSCCAAGRHDGEKWYDASGPSAPAKVRQLHGAGVLMLTSRSRSKPSRRS